MVDPDAPSPQDPTARFLLHWLQTDMTTAPQAADGTSQLINSTQPHALYRPPSPPPNSSAHRYILYAFFQHENFTFPPAFEGYNAENRTDFNLTLFLEESNLGHSPAAAMYFFVSNETQVPPNFTAAAGQTYPGGNGDMVTAGPGPSATATGSTASASAKSGGLKTRVGIGGLLFANCVALLTLV
jgi:phosphatidylethanolamine-binding protein